MADHELLNSRVVQFFKGVIRRNPDLCKRLEEFPGEMISASETLVFTLHGLWSFLTAVGMLSDPFPNFQQALYRGALNQRLADY
ncbi:MAG: hypothetical protein MI864_26535, partial [Pseudomonadales bacterium]|nr:hypothetical protein [Pseudomonadales bacterium]